MHTTTLPLDYLPDPSPDLDPEPMTICTCMRDCNPESRPEPSCIQHKKLQLQRLLLRTQKMARVHDMQPNHGPDPSPKVLHAALCADQ